MTWAAVIPLRIDNPKTRLAGRLDGQQRQALSQKLFLHVATVLRNSPAVAEVIVLSSNRPSDWRGLFAIDNGMGLNAELLSLSQNLRSRLLIMHADLPLLSVEDVAILLSRAGNSIAIAPDRHDTGTNALALAHPESFDFSFGPNSFERHAASANGIIHVVKRLGLGLDVDTPADLEMARSCGFLFSL